MVLQILEGHDQGKAKLAMINENEKWGGPVSDIAGKGTCAASVKKTIGKKTTIEVLPGDVTS